MLSFFNPSGNTQKQVLVCFPLDSHTKYGRILKNFVIIGTDLQKPNIAKTQVSSTDSRLWSLVALGNYLEYHRRDIGAGSHRSSQCNILSTW